LHSKVARFCCISIFHINFESPHPRKKLMTGELPVEEFEEEPPEKFVSEPKTTLSAQDELLAPSEIADAILRSAGFRRGAEDDGPIQEFKTNDYSANSSVTKRVCRRRRRHSANISEWRRLFRARGDHWLLGARRKGLDDDALMKLFWSGYYDLASTSIFKMVYNESNKNENLDDSVKLVKAFMDKTAATASMESYYKDHCFGIVHVLYNLEIVGLWFFNALNPNELCDANKDASLYTWSQMGTDLKESVADILQIF